ncbi:hypothetical protein D3C81_1802590 [compost metagenome]
MPILETISSPSSTVGAQATTRIMVRVSHSIPAAIPARQCCFFGILRLIQPDNAPAIMLVIKQGIAVTPPISIR